MVELVLRTPSSEIRIGIPSLIMSTENEEERFAFGENWKAFLSRLDDERVEAAVNSLKTKLGVDTLSGKRFLDIGCGSGLFSLAAHRLGAEVVSFDYDESSVACTEYLKSTYAESSPTWSVHQGSVLDSLWLNQLGTFDVVYSWGVLHHTGQMKKAVRLSSALVADDGSYFIALYNDQAGASRRWLKIKQLYNKLPAPLNSGLVAIVAGYYEIKYAVGRLIRGKNPLPFEDWQQKKAKRGMSAWYDWVDWVGGLPFEVASPDEVINPLVKSGFSLRMISTVQGGWGCNEYVFVKRKN